MITADGWFDFAERHPGPADKVWGDVNALQGVVFHSAEGSLQGVINIVMGPASNNRSVTGVVGLDGRFVQFYPVQSSPWANGSHVANKTFLGIEHENSYENGHPVETPLTDAQVATDVRILTDLAAFKGPPGWDWRRPTSSDDLHATLYEHLEMRRFGAGPTQCPSGRIRWPQILAGLQPAPDPRDVQLSIDAAVRDAIDALASGRWIARHDAAKGAVILQVPPGTDATGWLALR